MDERLMQFRVGVVVVAVTLIAGFLTLLFGHFPTSLVNRSYTIYIEFPQAPGVAVDTPVRKSGILIGRVTKVELIGERQDRVRVTTAIENTYKILHSDVVRINVSLLGDAELQVVNGHNHLPNTPVAPGETITGVVINSPTQTLANIEPAVTEAARALTDASDQVRQLAGHVDKLLGNNNGQFNRLLTKTERSLDLFQTTMTNVDSIIGDRETNAKLRQGLAELPTTLKQAQDALALIQRTSAHAERNLENLEGFTKPLGERGEAIIDNADQSVRRLDEILGQLQEFSRQLNGREGSLGQLIHNPELYQNLSEAASNVNELSRRLRPILEDVRAFTDKIARHPEVLGINGALHKSSGIK